MAVSLGAVASGLLALGNAPTEATLGADAAKLLGIVMMPVAISFAVYAATLYLFRRDLLRKDDLYNPEMHATKTPLLLGYVLCAALCAIFLLDLFGAQVHL
jgi:hypothetical protein